MATLEEDFNDFIAYRIGELDAEILNLYHSIPACIEENVTKIESLASNRAYKTGFSDALRLMAGLNTQ